MALFSVDPDKCKRDGICAAICPARIIRGGDKEIPYPVADARDFCIGCGQCVAICPHGALTHNLMGPDDCLPVKKDWRLDPEHAEHFLRSRRSIRAYKQEPVDRDTIGRLIAMARYAPSARNLQPVHWTVFHDTDKVRRLSVHVVDWMRYMIETMPEIAATMNMDRLVADFDKGIDVICRNAPHLVMAHGDKEDQTGPTSGTIALAYMELAAPSLGLGTCWAGYLGAAAIFWTPLQEALDLPPGHACFGALMLGYPKFAYPLMPARNPPSVHWR